MKARQWRTLTLTGVVLAALAAGSLLGPMLVDRFAYAAARGRHRAAMEELAELSKTDHMSPLFRAVVKATLPSVVEVRVAQRIKVDRMPFGEFDDLEEFFRRHFGDRDVPPRLPRDRGKREFLRRGQLSRSGARCDHREYHKNAERQSQPARSPHAHHGKPPFGGLLGPPNRCSAQSVHVVLRERTLSYLSF